MRNDIEEQLIFKGFGPLPDIEERFLKESRWKTHKKHFRAPSQKRKKRKVI